jgi:hypothetical protein
MTLAFISGTSVPNYIALSSDIVDGRICGACVVGGTVLITDTGDWYVVGCGLELQPFRFPINLGLSQVGQGAAGSDPWPVEIDPRYATLQVSPTKYSMITSDESHFHAHDGTLWSASYLQTGISSSAVIDVACSVGDRHAHVNLTHCSTRDAKVEFYGGDVVYTGGTSIPVINHDLSISASAGNPDVSFSISPTITSPGVVFRSLLIAGGTSGHKSGAGMSPFSTEFIIPPNTKSYMRYTNLDGNDSAYSVLIDFYEA